MARQRRGRGEGGIYQRSDGRWCAAFSDGYTATGKRARRIIYGTTKTEVAKKLRAIQQQSDAGQLPDAKDVTVKAWLTRWLSIIKPTIEPGTLVPYTGHVEKHIVPRIGQAKIQRLKASDIEALYAHLLRDGVSPAMVRKIGTTLTVALNHAVRSRQIVSNPALGIKKPKATKKDIQVLGVEDAVKFIAACDGERLGALFVLMLDAGLRPGETLALTWSDVDFERGTISVTKSLEEIDGRLRLKTTKTKKGLRQIDITPATLGALNRHRAAMLVEGWDVRKGIMFVNTIGTHISVSNLHNNTFKPLLKRAGLQSITLYGLRHTCATLLLLANVNPKVVSERLGHSSITLTLDTYSHVLPGMQRAAADILARLLSSPPTANANA